MTLGFIGFRVQGVGFSVKGLGFSTEGLGIWESKIWWFGLKCEVFGV